MTTSHALFFSFLLAGFSSFVPVTLTAGEQPIQHLKLEDIKSYQEAKRVFIDTTAQIKSKTKLDPAELHDIHMITYSLEKALAYFVDTMEGEPKQAVEKMAAVIELVHLGSENNRKVETQIYLEDYFLRAALFAKELQ